ncbi:MAG: PDZ domain-containing protein [Fibrobacter sp.]|mgnify:CR=1 FL=1|nr:PDZ domain-containing protein [Fibrobacter sp.]
MRFLLVVLLSFGLSFANTEAFGGLGVTVQGMEKGVTIVEVLPASPAATLGIIPGDQILAVDGFVLADQSLEVAVSKLRGEPGTTVRFLVHRPNTGEAWNAELSRVDLRVKSISSTELNSWYGSTQAISKDDIQYYAELQGEKGFDLLGVLQNGRVMTAETPVSAHAPVASVYAGEARKNLSANAPRFARVQLKGFSRDRISFQVDEIASVELHLLDLAGNIVHRWVLSSPHVGVNSLNWDGSVLATGAYTLRASAANGKAAWRVQLH